MSYFFTLKDFLDILITALMFYGIYLFIRGTRALQVLMGLGVLVMFAAFVDWFQLRTMDFLFSNLFFLQVGAIFLIVVFQPEIRSGLANLGQQRLWPLIGELQSETLIKSLVKAVESMSKREIGALIALEQEVGLKNYIKTGTEVNSRVTSELIMTIFMSKGPLHDGGLVIQDNFIAAAGCIFPLSDRADLPSEFGTRHRAGVGLAEESDAVVIIISEETGKITLLHESELMTDIDLETLENGLYRYLAE